MRALHLCFWLHHPYELNESSRWRKGYFGGEEDFRRAERERYQPLFALLERNAQRYPKLRVSLVVSGVWLEQAERWSGELIERLRKLVERGNVELVGTTYYAAMAGFYDFDEMRAQIEQHREKLKALFDTTPTTLALPELTYHNRLALLAEKASFAGFLAGDARGTLDWRTANRVYAAKGCERLQVLFENTTLDAAIREASRLVTVEVEDEVKVQAVEDTLETEAETRPATAMDFVRGLSESQRSEATRMGERRDEAREQTKMRTIFSARMLQKQLDLALLRGNIVNLVLDPEIFARWRGSGVVGFFDELLKIWSETPGLRLVGVNEALQLPVAGEIAVKKTASARGEAEKEYALPAWWSEAQAKNSEELYRLRRDVLATRDRDILADYRKLTAADYARGGDNYRAILDDLRRRVGELVTTAGATRPSGLAESTTVKVNFKKKPQPETPEEETPQFDLYEQFKQAAGLTDEEGRPFWSGEDMDAMEAAIQVMAQRMKRTDQEREHEFDDATEAELIGDEEVAFEGDLEFTEDEPGVEDEFEEGEAGDEFGEGDAGDGFEEDASGAEDGFEGETPGVDATETGAVDEDGLDAAASELDDLLDGAERDAGASDLLDELDRMEGILEEEQTQTEQATKPKKKVRRKVVLD